MRGNDGDRWLLAKTVHAIRQVTLAEITFTFNAGQYSIRSVQHPLASMGHGKSNRFLAYQCIKYIHD